MRTHIDSHVLINDLLTRYVNGVDLGKPIEVANLFGATGILIVHGGAEHHGFAEVEQFFVHSRASKIANNLAGLRHHLSSVQIEADGSDAATARSYFMAMTENGVDHWGVWNDKLVREAGEWRFAERRVLIEGADPTGWIGSGSGSVPFSPAGPETVSE
jgi:hypothetical protein